MAENIRVIIRERRAQVDGGPVIICGNSDYTITFDFDSDWSAAGTRTARFVYVKSGQVQHEDVIFVGSTVNVPVLSEVSFVHVGVFEGELCTTTPARISCQKSILCGSGELYEPTPDEYHQIMALFSQVTEQLAEHKQALDYHAEKLEEHGLALDSHAEQLEEHGLALDSHGGQLEEHGLTLDSHTEQLEGHTQALDSHAEQLEEHAEQLEKLGSGMGTHTHTTSDITDFPSTMAPSAHKHTKSEITDFPTTMPPSSHKHSKSDISDFPTTMPPSSHKHSKSDISDFPTTMTPSAHNQAASTITAGTFAGDVKAPASTAYTTAQIRNVVIVDTKPTVGAASPYPNGTITFVRK